jgi:hypothetical protein
MPRRSSDPCKFERLPLRPRDRRQLSDEVVLGVEESDRSVVGRFTTGSCSLI